MTRLSNMVKVEPGVLVQGSDDFYPEERPLREVDVSSFWVDVHPVTNAEFRRFVNDTGHVTVAERAPSPDDFPDVNPDDLVAGSLVFTASPRPVPLDDWRRWWRWQPGADWRHPTGPGSTLHGLERHPVVHVAQEDAAAYAAWAGRRLPSEEEWEYAARGGLVASTYSWGDDFMPNGRLMANTWHGDFPWRNDRPPWRNDRPARTVLTTPVGTFAPNGYGLFDTTGNVWEWTDTAWTASHADDTRVGTSCCAPGHGRDETTRMVMKGGSHLCAPSYCHRYRPAARQGQSIRSSTGHIGFRCVVDG